MPTARPSATPASPVRTAPRPRYRVEFPPDVSEHTDQHEAYFRLHSGGGVDDATRVRFHDYAEIYTHRGLYEQLFYDRLKCQSPRKVAEVLGQSVKKARGRTAELRVLDLGAGNGMAGEALAGVGVARMVGVDIIHEARDAAFRDRPGIYDHYYVTDFTELDVELRTELRSWAFDCLVSVAALGFGDIPPRAVAEALDLIQVDGWIAFNIKDTFLDPSDDTGFSQMVRELILSEYMDLYHLERYRHRLSIHGTPLNYFAVVGKKREKELPKAVREMLEAA